MRKCSRESYAFLNPWLYNLVAIFHTIIWIHISYILHNWLKWYQKLSIQFRKFCLRSNQIISINSNIIFTFIINLSEIFVQSNDSSIEWKNKQTKQTNIFLEFQILPVSWFLLNYFYLRYYISKFHWSKPIIL
jgi:hypothetical protein